MQGNENAKSRVLNTCDKILIKFITLQTLYKTFNNHVHKDTEFMTFANFIYQNKFCKNIRLNALRCCKLLML